MAPLPLLTGEPPVDTTVAEPPVRVSTSELLTACDGPTKRLFTVVELV